MDLLASVCDVKVIIPPNPSSAVVAGSAMLGRYAHEVAEGRKGEPISTQKQQEESAKTSREALWRIMVRNFKLDTLLRLPEHRLSIPLPTG